MMQSETLLVQRMCSFDEIHVADVSRGVTAKVNDPESQRARRSGWLAQDDSGLSTSPDRKRAGPGIQAKVF
jgi:hypothetical protein